MNATQRKNAVLYSLVGDALSLGPHWVYNQSAITRKLGEVTGYADPLSRYHPGKKAGDFTHYGDQTMALLRSLDPESGFSLQAFAESWRAFWEDPETTSYRDGATTTTLENLQGGAGPRESASPSNDIAGAARIAPLFLLPWEDPEALIATARSQTGFTHGDPAVVEAAEFFARVALDVAKGVSIHEAIEAAAKLDHWEDIPETWFASATQSARETPEVLDAAQAHGLTCHIPEAFPATIDLLLRYPNDAVAGLKANAHAGGDSAARGLLLGLVYGAAPEPEALPEAWLTQLAAKEEIDALIKDLES